MIDLVHTDKARSEFKLRRTGGGRQSSTENTGRNGRLRFTKRKRTMLFRSEMTMNCAFLVRSLM